MSRPSAEADADNALTPLQAASCTYRIALGPRAWQKVLSLQSLPRTDKPSTPGLCANAHGFSLHSAVRCGAEQRKELEHLCRYITLWSAKIRCYRIHLPWLGRAVIQQLWHDLGVFALAKLIILKTAVDRVENAKTRVRLTRCRALTDHQFQLRSSCPNRAGI